MLIVDNCEHLIGPVTHLVRDIFTVGPTLRCW